MQNQSFLIIVLIFTLKCYITQSGHYGKTGVGSQQARKLHCNSKLLIINCCVSHNLLDSSDRQLFVGVTFPEEAGGLDICRHGKWDWGQAIRIFAIC